MAKAPRRDAKKNGRPRKAVVVYMTSSCVQCRLLLEYLASKKIRHRTRDIIDDEGAMLELAELTGGRVQIPVVVAGEAVLICPAWKRLDQALQGKP
jgi:glutaredoxin